MRRQDLPELAYTIDPDGRAILLVNGKGYVPAMNATYANGEMTVQIMTTERYDRGMPKVEWATLAEIAREEEIEKIRTSGTERIDDAIGTAMPDQTS